MPRLRVTGTRRPYVEKESEPNLVGGPGFERGASRSRTGRMSCPFVSRRFLSCPPVLKLTRPLCPLVSFCVLLVPRMRDTAVISAKVDFIRG